MSKSGRCRTAADTCVRRRLDKSASGKSRGHEMTQFFRAIWPVTRTWRLAPFAWVVMVAVIAAAAPSFAQQPGSNVRPPSGAVVPAEPGGAEPGAVRPWNYDVEMWQQLRRGAEGKVTIPDSKAGRLVDSSGEAWRNFRNGPLPTYGAYLL